MLKRLPTSDQQVLDEQASVPESKVQILIVDDEENVLKVLSRILGEDYIVHAASSGKAALDILQATPEIALIVSDQRMPVMTGTEFLNRSININPDCIRIILTGYTDVKDLIESINAGRVFQYVTKPFEADDLRIIIKRGVDFYFQSRELELANKQIQQAYESLKSAQEQLIRSEKMSMLGKLMGSIAHEIRNPINNIGNSTKLLKIEWTEVRTLLENIQKFVTGKIKTDELKKSIPNDVSIADVLRDFESAVDIINHSCDLVSEIIEDLRGFSRLDDAEFVMTDLHAQIDRALALLKAKFKHQVEFHKEFGKIPKIMGLPGPISQVMINLLNNAAQASGDKGEVWIRTQNHNGHVVVNIRDNGVGISKENLEMIFEPGFTTKGGEEGTGLGLTISQEIMKKHKGKIEVESDPGKGTTFKLSFPVLQE